MTMYSRSDVQQITVSAAHGGCGQRHDRPLDGAGNPVQPWALTCDGCESFLRGSDHWTAFIGEIPETHDEVKAREQFEKRGVKDRDALMALVFSRMAGLSPAELPESVTRMIAGVKPHVPGEVLCPSGHGGNLPGARFCGQCGSPMSVAASAVALTAGAAA